VHDGEALDRARTEHQQRDAREDPRGAARRGALALEAGLFNGDEPEGPGDAPNRARFADSWAARLTATPAALLPGLELQASHEALSAVIRAAPVAIVAIVVIV
jgi:hypothetical protein